MIVKLLVILVTVVVVNGYNKPCSFRTDTYSPFYWRNSPNVCTKDLCYSYPWLQCGVSKEYILQQASGHYPEDILLEIEYLKKFFNTYHPTPRNQLPYSCTGICQDSVKQLQLQRIFTDIVALNENTGYNETQKHMCIIIGPDIYYQQCGGKCKIPFSTGVGYSCVADVKIVTDVWVYCPEAYPMCHKVKFEVPVSCSCKKTACKPTKMPAFQDIPPNVPLKPTGWEIGMNPFHISEIDNKPGNNLGPIPLGPGNPNIGLPTGLDPNMPIELLNTGVHIDPSAGFVPGKPVPIDMLPVNANNPGWVPNNPNVGHGNPGHGNQGHGNQGRGNQGHANMHIV